MVRIQRDFKGAPSKVKKALNAADEQGVVFAEGGKMGEYIPTCHGCGRKCVGGWRECKNIIEDHMSKVAALEKAGHFRLSNSNSRDTKIKKGTANVAAGARKDDDSNKSDSDTTKSESSNTSGLTEDMTLGELLRLTGVINITVGMRKTDGGIYEEDGSWDGDVLANIGVGFCQVQGEKPRQAMVINKQWLVQGRCGTNPFRSKSKIQKGAPSSLKECDVTQAERHEIKPAWVMESCLRKGGHKVSGGRRVKIKECDKVSKTRTALKTANNKASPIKSKIEAAVAKMLKKVIEGDNKLSLRGALLNVR